MRGLPLLIATLLIFAGSSDAQKTLKDSASIIQVRKEPRHHDVLDNEWVRILDVHIPPGDTSLFHKHTTPSVFFVLGNTRTGSQTLIEPRPRNFNKESIWFEDFTDTPRIHRVWNADVKEFRTIDVELPHKATGKAGAPISKPEFKLLFDEKPARGYRVTVGAGAGLRLSARPTPMVVIGLVGPAPMVSVNGKAFREKGAWFFLPAGQQLDIVNYKSTEPEEFAVLEIK